MSASGYQSPEVAINQEDNGPESIIATGDVQFSSPHDGNSSPPYLPEAQRFLMPERFDPVEKMANLKNDPTGIRLADESASKALANEGSRCQRNDGRVGLENRAMQVGWRPKYKSSAASAGGQVRRLDTPAEPRRRALPPPTQHPQQGQGDQYYRIPKRSRLGQVRRPVEADEDYGDEQSNGQQFGGKYAVEEYEVNEVVLDDEQDFDEYKGDHIHRSAGKGRVEPQSPMYYSDEVDDEEEEEEDEGLFIHGNGGGKQRRNMPTAAQRILGIKKRRYTHESFPSPSPPHKKKRGSGPSMKFRNIGEHLAESRYSGTHIPWSINQDPPKVPTESVGDAALLKRRLTRGTAKDICKRGYGANDPENIAIVNMKDHDLMSFAEIVEELNAKRVTQGKAPGLSVCGVTSRYNRTAPLLYTAEGKEFIPLSKRKKGDSATAPLTGKPVWNDDLDTILVECEQAIVAEKWERVAELFTKKTKRPMDPHSAARRHTML